MGRHGESIYKRKDGRWEARYIAERRADGRAVYRSVYAKSYKEAKEKRNQALRQSDTPRISTDFAAVVMQWLAEKEGSVKEQTLQKYRTSIRVHIAPFFDGRSLTELSSGLITEFMSGLRHTKRCDGRGYLSDHTVRGIATLLQALLNFASLHSFGNIPQIQIKKPQTKRKTHKILNLSEQQRLDRYLREQPQGSNLAIYLALHTGLRLGEICALQWENVDFAARQIHVLHTATRGQRGEWILGSPKSATSERVIPITERLSALLHDEKMRTDSPFVFSAPRQGTFLNPRTLQYRFRRILQSVGLRRVTFHALRHTFATRWIECGMDIKSLSEYLGHSGVQVTLHIYVHSSERLKREGIERLERFYGQKPGQTESAT